MPVVADLCVEGVLPLGPIAAFVDYQAGVLSIGAAAPQWIATQNLDLQLVAPVGSGVVHATSRAVRSGANTLISETELRDDAGQVLGHATVTYAKLTRVDSPAVAPAPEFRDLAEPVGVERPRQPLAVLLGFSVDLAQRELSFGHDVVLRNSTGAIQGGVVAIAMDQLGAQVASAALREPCDTVSLHVHYLAAGRKPPFVLRSEVLSTSSTGDSLVRAVLSEEPTGRSLAYGISRVSARR